MTGHKRPVTSCVYQNHSLDSVRWKHYRPRAGDVVVASSYKSGTTWVQMIVLQLLHPEERVPAIMERSPWLESPMRELDETLATLEAQSGRRVIKSHLPLDGLVYHEDVRYILVGRDPRDVFMSLFNHYRHLIRWPFLRMPHHPKRVGAPLPACPGDARDFWRQWITRGWFPWEREGYPFWSNLRHTETWWKWRHLSNILFVHFNDLLRHRSREIRRIADHLEVAILEVDLQAVVEAAGFERMRQSVDALIPSARTMFVGGGQTFLFRGTNERWRGVLNDEDLALYCEAAKCELSEDCRAWLERKP